jgi:hypothetical protein
MREAAEKASRNATTQAAGRDEIAAKANGKISITLDPSTVSSNPKSATEAAGSDEVVQDVKPQTGLVVSQAAPAAQQAMLGTQQAIPVSQQAAPTAQTEFAVQTESASSQFGTAAAEDRISPASVAGMDRSQAVKQAGLGAKRETTSTMRAKVKDAVAKSAHGENASVATTVLNAVQASVTPQLAAQFGAGQAVGLQNAGLQNAGLQNSGLQNANPSGLQANGEGLQGLAESAGQLKVASTTMGQDLSVKAGKNLQNAGVKPFQGKGAGSFATGNVAAGEKITTTASAVESGARVGAKENEADAATSAGGSALHVHTNGLQSAEIQNNSVATDGLTGTASIATPTSTSSLASTSSAGAELRSAAAGSADGVVSTGHQVLASTPTHLDVGVFDGTHGWLQIRAELNPSGGVNASLTTSTAAHDAVRAAVPEMTNYLHGEDLNVSRIAVHRAAQTSTSMDATQRDGQQNGSAHGQREMRDDSGAAQRNSSLTRGSEADSASSVTSAATDDSAVSGIGSGAVDPSDWVGGLSRVLPGVGMADGGWRGGGGSWLNVRA